MVPSTRGTTGQAFKPLSLRSFLRQTPFRLTMLFIVVYALVAGMIFGYFYFANAAETRALTDMRVKMRIAHFADLYGAQGEAALRANIDRDASPDWFVVEVVHDGKGHILAQNRRARDLRTHEGFPVPADMTATQTFQKKVRPSGSQPFYLRGQAVPLGPDLYLYVAMDTSWADRGWHLGVRAIWGGAALLIILGLMAGLLINREVSRSVYDLMKVLDAVREGDLKARVALRYSGDEFDALAERINDTLDRMEVTIGNLKYAGDAIAHDLRTPLSRLRARLEVALYEVKDSATQAPDVLERALADTDQLLRTFQTVFAMSRLEAQGQAPDQQVFDAHGLACDMAELFEPLAQDKGLAFDTEFASDLKVSGNRDFLAQALANLLDNAIKYTQAGGITFRLRRTSEGSVEFSVTDTGQGVPEADRIRIIQRFVRLENSRSLPGAGLGLSLVQAVAHAHGGRLAIDEGPGIYKKGIYVNGGPGLRTALVLPSV
ncbi:MAG: HAMP domain-containing sensor histidine kinase [Asticcacaulis sp.]